MRVRLLPCLAVVVSCASARTESADTRRPETARVSDGRSMAMGASELRDGRDGTVAAPLARVWTVLPIVMDSLGIPVTLRDPATWRVGAESFEVRRMLGGTMVSRYFDCGEGRGGNSALSYDLLLTVVSQLHSRSATETGLSTTTTVRARPIATSGTWIRCESRGLLEQRIEEGVATRLR